MSNINYCTEQAHNLTAGTFQMKVYAVITDKKGKILSEGSNSYTKTHTFQFHCARKIGLNEKCFLHAEISAICKLNYHTKDKAHTIYISRAAKTGGTLLAAPCPICQEAISQTGIQEIVYTTRDGFKKVKRKTLHKEAFNDSESNKDS